MIIMITKLFINFTNSAREQFKKNHGEKDAYLVEASIRRVLDTTHGLLGYTPAILAAEIGNEEILMILLNAGSNELSVDFVGTSMLHAAASGGHTRCIDILVKKVNIDLKDKRGDTALHWAASRGNMKIVEKLVTSGANVNSKNLQG